MASEFLQRLIKKRPDIVGQRIYFCTKKKNLACIIRRNGTISPISSPGKEFRSANELVQSFASGEAEDSCFNVGKKIASSKYRFSVDLFLYPNRRVQLSSLASNASGQLPGPIRVQRDCDGFALPDVPLTTIRGFNILDLKCLDNDHRMRSELCTGVIADQSKAMACVECSSIKQRVQNRVSILRRRHQLCPGVPASRKRVATVCNLVKPAKRRRCEDCQKTRRKQRDRKQRKKAVNEESRLLRSPVKYLRQEELSKRAQLLQDRREQKIRSLRKKLASATKASEKELEKFKPRDAEDQKAIASATKYFNAESTKQRNQVCLWKVDGGTTCGFDAANVKDLFQHLNKTHVRVQVRANKIFEPLERNYHCKWSGCSRRAPYEKCQLFFDHVKKHVGSTKGIERMVVFREQLRNLIRHPNGRRHGPEAKSAAISAIVGVDSSRHHLAATDYEARV